MCRFYNNNTDTTNSKLYIINNLNEVPIYMTSNYIEIIKEMCLRVI